MALLNAKTTSKPQSDFPHMEDDPKYQELTREIEILEQTVADAQKRLDQFYHGPSSPVRESTAADVQQGILAGKDLDDLDIVTADDRRGKLVVFLQGAKLALSSKLSERTLQRGHIIPTIVKRPDIRDQTRAHEHKTLSLMVDLLEALHRKARRYSCMDSHGLVAAYRPVEQALMPYEQALLHGGGGIAALKPFVQLRAQIWNFPDIERRVAKLK